MSNHVEKLKKCAIEISETKKELEMQNKINIGDLSIVDELFSILLEDDFAVSEIESLSKSLNMEHDMISDNTIDNKEAIIDISNETDDFIKNLGANVRRLEQMQKKSDLVDVGQQINNTKKRIGDLEGIKQILKVEITDNSQTFDLFPYVPVSPEYAEQYEQLAEQYGNEINSNEKEKIRAIGELFALENDLNLTDGFSNIPQVGGLYGEITKKKNTNLKDFHAHHIPPKSVSDNIGDNKKGDILPAIFLTGEDHKLTASYGGGMSAMPKQTDFELNSKNDTRPYKDRLIEQINNGNYADAFRNEVLEIKHLFGDKYDGAIKQAIEANRNYLQKFGNPKVKREN